MGNLLRSAPVTYRGSSGALNIFSGAGKGEVRQMEAYGEVGTVYAIVNRLASATAAVDWHLYRKARSGLKADRVEVTSHAALDLLNKPNTVMTRQEMFEIGQQHIDLTGEADILMLRAGKIPIELWPVRPDKVTPVPGVSPIAELNAFNIFAGYMQGYVYSGPNGEKVPLDTSDVLQLRMPNPLDPYCGLGPVQSILTDIDSSKYSAEWNKNFFLNSAEPGGIVQVDKRLGDDEFREMRERWAEQHKGVAKAHRVAIIEQGAQWIDRKITQRDMQFAELSRLSRDKILEAFGFPKSMIGIVEDVNRANAEASEYMFAKWLIVPRLERWKGTLNQELLPMYSGGDALEFDYDSPVPENSDQENAAWAAKGGFVASLVPLGFDPAETLAAVGLPDIAFTTAAPIPAPAPPITQAALEKTFTAWLDSRIDDAMKWEAVEEEDDSTCEPCKANNGKLYKNREEAYKDYPNGEGYKDCVGEEFGNSCRGHVRKRKAD